MLLHPAWGTVFKSPIPKVTVLDTKSSITDATIYTFSACNIGLGVGDGDLGGNTLGATEYLRSPSRSLLGIFVHGQDATTLFTVSTITVGGTSIAIHADSGGAALASTAFAWDPMQRFAGIANTDVVVTFSEAVTSCAIGILCISNIGILTGTGLATASNQGTGLTSLNLSQTAFTGENFPWAMVGSTLAGVSEQVAFSPADPGCVAPMLLYEFASAEASYAAAWTYSPQYNAGNTGILSISTSWSGAANCDVIGAALP